MVADKFDEINHLVRQANVSLFVGSGFSLKAGGPSAGMLVRSLATRFPKGYKKGLRSLPLDDISKEYVRLHHGQRDELISFLKEKMAFKRKNLLDHQALALIPHIRHIFTTNYDTLLEDSYPADSVRVVRCDGDCALPEKEVNIYKIHGDLASSDQLVITRDDYDKLLATDKNSLVWNKVIGAFAGTDVVFVGYSLDDTNVQILLDRVSAKLGDERRRVFLIAPNLAEEKVYELRARKVEYIDAYAEDFLQSLTAELKDSICSDLMEGIVPQEIAVRFFNLYQIKTVLEFSEGKIDIKSIDPSTPFVPQTLRLTVKAKPGDKRNPFDFDFEEMGDRSGTLRIPSLIYTKESIVDFERRINGVKVMGLDELSRIEIAPSILKEGQMDIVVPSADFLESVPYKTFRSKEKLVVTFETPLCFLDFSWDVNDYKATNCRIKTVYKEDYGEFEKAVSWTEFFISLFGGKEVFLGRAIGGKLDPGQYVDLVDQFKKSLLYYENVRKIELIRRQSFAKHLKYEDGFEEISSVVLHLLVGDSLDEKLNMNGRIECQLNPGAELPVSYSGDTEPVEFAALRMSHTTEQEVILNEVSFGRVTKWKDLLKCHAEQVYEKDGNRYVSFAPDVDHWVVRYVKAGE